MGQHVIRLLVAALLAVGVGEPEEGGVQVLVRGILGDELVEGRGRLRVLAFVNVAAPLREGARRGVGVARRLDEAVEQLAALRAGARRGGCEHERESGQDERALQEARAARYSVVACVGVNHGFSSLA